MRILRVDPLRPEPEPIARAAAVLREGGLVVFPTETVYGLGAHALDEAAVRRLFTAKGRPSFNPLIVHVRDIESARVLVAAWPDRAQRLADAFWPGPLTLVLPKHPRVPDLVTAGLTTVAVRVPAHPVALALLESAGLPIAAPSANPYTELSPTTAAHVAARLGDRVDLILDGGQTDVGIESSVVDLTGTRPRLLRPGTVSVQRIAHIVGPLDPAAPRSSPDAPRAAPGMIGRHYAPRAALRMFLPDARERAVGAVLEAAAAGVRTGALLIKPLAAPLDHPITMPHTPRAYAARLYAALHELDDAGCGLVLVEQVPASPEWQGIRDRLERAAEPAEPAG